MLANQQNRAPDKTETAPANFFVRLLLYSSFAYLPTFFIPFVHIDEGAWAEMGRFIFSGNFYRTISDNKPPFLMEFHWLLSLGEHSILALHLLLALWTAIGAYVFFKLLRDFFSEQLSSLGAILFALLCGTLNYGAFSAERALLPFIFVSALALRNAKLRSAPLARTIFFFAAGVALGLAINIKQTAALFAPALLVYFYVLSSARTSSDSIGQNSFWKRLQAEITCWFMGVMGIVIASCIAWKMTGTPFHFIWQEAFAQNFQYVQFQNYSHQEVIREVLLDALLVFGLAYAALTLGVSLLLALLLQGRINPWKNLGALLMIATLIFAAFTSVSLGQRFFQQYYTMALPTLIMMTLIPLALFRSRHWSRFFIGVALASLAIFHVRIATLQWTDHNKNYDSEIEHLVSEIQKDSHASQTIWISNALGSVYYLANRRPAIKYLFFLHLIHFAEICRAEPSALREDLSNPRYVQALGDLQKNNPQIVFWVTRGVNSCSDRLKLKNFPSIEKWLRSKYELKWTDQLGSYYIRKPLPRDTSS